MAVDPSDLPQLLLLNDDALGQIFRYLNTETRNTLRLVSRSLRAVCARMKTRRYAGRDTLTIEGGKSVLLGNGFDKFVTVSFAGQTVRAWVTFHADNYSLNLDIPMIQRCLERVCRKYGDEVTALRFKLRTCTDTSALCPIVFRCIASLKRVRYVSLGDIHNAQFSKCPPIPQPIHLEVTQGHVRRGWLRLFENIVTLTSHVGCELGVFTEDTHINTINVKLSGHWVDKGILSELSGHCDTLNVHLHFPSRENCDVYAKMATINNIGTLTIDIVRARIEKEERIHEFALAIKAVRCSRLVLRPQWLRRGDAWRAGEKRKRSRWVQSFDALLHATGAAESARGQYLF